MSGSEEEGAVGALEFAGAPPPELDWLLWFERTDVDEEGFDAAEPEAFLSSLPSEDNLVVSFESALSAVLDA